MAGFVLLGAYLVADWRFARHTVSDAGMDFGRPTGRRVAFGWAEVGNVRFSKSWNWFRIELRSGEVVRVSGMMTGLPEFAARVLEGLPETRIDGATLAMLRDTANGKLPPVWE
nr:PH domain-containing protein [Massilia varians]